MENSTFLIEMGRRIRETRKVKNITLQQLCELTEIARDNLSLVERGKRNPHILSLKAIADVLEMDVKDFL